jgi:hypothetical protein
MISCVEHTNQPFSIGQYGSVKAAVQRQTMAQLKLTDEPIKQLRGLQDAMRTVKCNKQSRQYYQMLDEHLSVLTPAMEKQISSMIDAASFGETLKQGQLKALQVGVLQSERMA